MVRLKGNIEEIPCQRCGYSPAIMMERDGKNGLQQAIVCGSCMLAQFIEWTGEEE